ncbi:MAG: glycine--tRNA ligase subunit beta [Betaproteobacteria bacterium TMED82]|nr:MAG: glycine--tRNA ligase subunit beta [Betaproteobacteria bacterium TMED82]|tara:strand:+ start:11075 stop:13189 length:2115 start_codon:yes stop_codon:yes gene_type:complete
MSALLIELLTEELPPNALERLSEQFCALVFNELSKRGFLVPETKKRIFATPRRFGFLLTNIKKTLLTEQRKIKIMPKRVAFNEDLPTKALLKKLRAVAGNDNLSEKNLLNKITFENSKNEEFVFFEKDTEHIELSKLLQGMLEKSISNLPIPKPMFYQKQQSDKSVIDIHFIRPVHSILALLDNEIVPLHLFGLKASNISKGHRFIGNKSIEIQTAGEYESKITLEGSLIPNFSLRKEEIKKQILTLKKEFTPLLPDSLLNEITALCEKPKVYKSKFDPKFLSLPQECLVLTMQKNQKYIPLKDKTGILSNEFLFCSNISPKNPSQILSGNERVLTARLNDAAFFFAKDKEVIFNSLENKLISITYHNELGNLAERVSRIKILCKKFANYLNVSEESAEKAAELSKNDLVTLMVSEFPELQGVMGRYYAENAGEDSDVCQAIGEQYNPRFSGDTIPNSPLGCCLALAEKMENVVGLTSLGILPSGEKDPMGMRRNALGIVRILVESRIQLSLEQVLTDSLKLFPRKRQSLTYSQIIKFFSDRVFFFFKEKGYDSELINSCLLKCDLKFAELPERITSLQSFLNTPSSKVLCSLNKRIYNILKKSEPCISESNIVDANLFSDATEKKLFEAIENKSQIYDGLLKKKEFEKAFDCLTDLEDPTASFFESVMVNVEDLEVRKNRLSLLSKLYNQMNKIADLSVIDKS